MERMVSKYCDHVSGPDHSRFHTVTASCADGDGAAQRAAGMAAPPAAQCGLAIHAKSVHRSTSKLFASRDLLPSNRLFFAGASC